MSNRKDTKERVTPEQESLFGISNIRYAILRGKKKYPSSEEGYFDTSPVGFEPVTKRFRVQIQFGYISSFYYNNIL